jgi:zinc transporter
MNLISSEIPGLVWAYRFLPGESRCLRIAADSSINALTEGEGWVWLHLALSDARTPALIDRIATLPQGALSTLTSQDTQAAVIVSDDMVYGTLVDF